MEVQDEIENIWEDNISNEVVNNVNEGTQEACNNFNDFGQYVCNVWQVFQRRLVFTFLEGLMTSQDTWNTIYQKQSDSTIKG